MKLMSNPDLYLPKRYDEKNFEHELYVLFTSYLDKLSRLQSNGNSCTDTNSFEGYQQIQNIIYPSQGQV